MVYLGHLVTEDGRCEKEIQRRMAIARGAFENLATSLTSRNINIPTRYRLAKCYVWSTLLYGVETWTLTEILSNKIEALEMWILRRMLRITWKDKKSNKEVLKMAKTERSLLQIIKKRKMVYFGHIIRRNTLQRQLLEGKITGKRGRGRPRAS